MVSIHTLILLAYLGLITPTWARSFPAHAHQPMVGQLSHVMVQASDRITDLAEKHSIGMDAMQSANPSAPLQQLIPGTQLLLPTAYLLPSTRSGIVINLPEKRLYYFHAGRVYIFPTAIGRVHHSSRQGSFKTTDKRFEPVWNVPPSILKEEHAKGNPIPSVFPHGPENPLGKHAIRLSHSSILIHGTNFPPGVGKRSTTGCFSLYPEDIATLFDIVAIGTSVTVINEPVKIAKTPEGLWIESHPTLEQTNNHECRKPTASEIESNVLKVLKDYPHADTLALHAVFSENMGIPILVKHHDH